MTEPPSGDPQPRRVVAGVALGFSVILAAAGLFALIASQATPTGALGRADQALADALAQQLPHAVLRFFSVLTHLGDPVVLGGVSLAVAVPLWRRGHRTLMLGWLLAPAGNALLNPMLKRIFERARPVHDHGLVAEAGFSFPSGHSSGAMVVYGMAVYLAWRLLPPRWLGLVAGAGLAVVLGTACSRVILQVHFASDVAAGLLSGLAWLTVCILSIEAALDRTSPTGR